MELENSIHCIKYYGIIDHISESHISNHGSDRPLLAVLPVGTCDFYSLTYVVEACATKDRLNESFNL